MRKLPLSYLAKVCAEKGKKSGFENYCVELFRRAIEENDEDSWEIVRENYLRLVLKWVNGCITADSMPNHIEGEDVAQQVFLEFAHSYTAEKLYRADGLQSILCYLKSCVYSECQRICRKNKVETICFSDESFRVDLIVGESDTDLIITIDSESLWRLVETLCNNADEKLLVQATFVWDMKPAEIAVKYPESFATAHDVSLLKQKLLSRLKRHPKFNLFQ